MLFTVFDGDTRVDPVHARKMCAAMQHATSARWPDRPVLLRREAEVGHGARGVSRSVALSADTLAFLAFHTGLSVGDQRLPVVAEGREVAMLGRHRLAQRAGGPQHQPGPVLAGQPGQGLPAQPQRLLRLAGRQPASGLAERDQRPVQELGR